MHATRNAKPRRARLTINFAEVFVPLLFVVLIGVGVLLFMPQAATKVSINVLVSSVTWTNVDTIKKNPERFGLAFASNDSIAFVLPPATITSNLPKQLANSAQVVLWPLKPYQPVRIEALDFPNEAKVRLTQLDTTALKLDVGAARTGDAASVLRWQVVFQQRVYLNPLTGTKTTLGQANAEENHACNLKMEKSLRSGEIYSIVFNRPHNWKAPARLVATNLEFAESDVTETEVLSSVLSGTVKMLETNDQPIALSERDVLKVKFTKPVEIFLHGTSAGIALHVDGIASQVLCGPKIMGADNDRMPLLIKSYNDKAPYIGGSLAVLLPSLFLWIIELRKKKPEDS